MWEFFLLYSALGETPSDRRLTTAVGLKMCVAAANLATAAAVESPGRLASAGQRSVLGVPTRLSSLLPGIREPLFGNGATAHSCWVSPLGATSGTGGGCQGGKWSGRKVEFVKHARRGQQLR